MTRSKQLIDFSKVIGGGSSRSVFKAAAVSLIALTAAMASGRAEGQDTTISGDFSAYANIYGNHGATPGTVDATASTSDNNVTFEGDAATTGGIKIYGALGELLGIADGNKVIINAFGNGNDYEIYGGRARSIASSAPSVDVGNNEVTITAGTFSNDGRIHGGYAYDHLTGQTLSVADNAVTVTGGEFQRSTFLHGGGARINKTGNSATVTGNKVTVTGGEFNTPADSLDIHGGYISSADDVSSADAAVKNNTVTIEGGTFNGFTLIYGGYAYTIYDVTVTGNKVYIKGGTFADRVWIAGGVTEYGTASGNEVYLSGGTFADNTTIIPGIVDDGERTIKNNTVYVSGDVNLSKVSLLGAGDDEFNPVQSGGGNTLVFGENGKPWNGKDNKIAAVYGFDTVRITAATWNKPITVAYFDTTYAQNGKTEIDATKVAFAGIDSVKKGDKTELFVAQELSAGSELTLKSAKSTYTVGTTLQGDGTVAFDGVGTVTYEIDSAENRSAQPQAHTAAMASAAKMTALKQGADTAQAALSNLSGSGKTGMQGFAAMGGGTARQETGSHLTLNAVNFTAGMGGTMNAGAAKLTVGGALEAGHGSFKNHFDAGDADPYINKKGHVNYYGGAVLTEMRWASDWHMNANLRAGYAKTEQTAALYNAGTNTAYDVDSGAYYVGTEIGGGKVLGLTDNQSVDLYGKYIYLHQGGDSFEAGGHYDIKGVDSHRLRLGGRYDYGFNKTWGLYAGLAGEYEFDGKGRVMADGAEVLPAKTKGMRGIGELGVKLTPEESGFSMDVNVKGSVGKYRSALFGIDVKYEF